MKSACSYVSVALMCLATVGAAAQAPVIESVTPTSGPISTSVTISGANFSPTPSENIVYFGGVRAVVSDAATNSLIVTVPAGATYEPITVTTGGLTAASRMPFIVTFRGSEPVQFDGNWSYGTDNSSPDPTILIGDLNGDGKPDMVGTGPISRGGNGTTDGALLLFRNRSTPGSLDAGSFANMATLYPNYPNVTMTAAGAAIADLDGDGKLDLVITEMNPGLLVIYRNIGDTSSLDESSFAPAVMINLPNVLGSRQSLGITDVDRDGRPDILICGYSGLSAFRNLTSPGTIDSNSFAPPVDVFTNAIPYSIAIADFDLDGKPDVALLADGGVALLRNAAAGPGISYGIFADPVMLNYPPGQPPITIVTADMDGDGKTDLVTYQYVDCCSAKVTLFRNLTSGPGLTTDSFGGKAEIPVPYYQSTGMVAAGDLNGDGKLDLVVLTPKINLPADATVSLFLNQNSPGSLSAGSFAAQPDLTVNYGYTPYWLSLADMDGDGKNDIILSRPTSNGGSSPKGFLTIYHNATPPPPNSPPTISIVSPTNDSVFVTPVDITISVNAGDTDGIVTQVLLHAGSDLVGSSATSPFTITWSNVLAGNYTLRATATDDSGNATVSSGVGITVNGPPVPPSITLPPESQSAPLGSNATFTVTATGTAPLSYQWLFNGTNPLGSATASLTLTNVQFAQTGDYSVYVSNSAGSVTSSPARLTVIPPGDRLVQAANSSGAPGGTVRVPIVLVGQGDENALGFSLAFPSSLSYITAELGGGATNATLNLNADGAASGRIGISLALSAGASFPAGTQELVVVTFAIAPGIGNTAAAISFGDQPLVQEISDALANSLHGTFVGCTLTISGGGYEADVSPAPEGNGAITVTDWVKVGRYAAGLDTVSNASQFQRADCAPRSTLGNGGITVTDWVQAGRYAAGLDPLTSAGGPTGPPGSSGSSALKFSAARVAGARELRASKTAIYPGQTNRLSVVLVAQGNESAVGFSISFDPALATFVSAGPGTNAGGAVVNVNTSEAAMGRVGVVLSLPIGTAFAAGTQELAAVRFAARANAIGSGAVMFSNQPVRLDISDVLANSVPVTYLPGTLQVAPSLRINPAGANRQLSWPSWAKDFVLEASDTLSATSIWTPPPELETTVTGGEIHFVTPGSSDRRFFRLRLP